MSIFARHKIANKIIINKIIKKKTMKRVFGIFIVMSLLFLGACTTSETNETDLVDTTVNEVNNYNFKILSDGKSSI